MVCGLDDNTPTFWLGNDVANGFGYCFPLATVGQTNIRTSLCISLCYKLLYIVFTMHMLVSLALSLTSVRVCLCLCACVCSKLAVAMTLKESTRLDAFPTVFPTQIQYTYTDRYYTHTVLHRCKRCLVFDCAIVWKAQLQQ